jgi:hypothetical protein
MAEYYTIYATGDEHSYDDNKCPFSYGFETVFQIR